MIAVYGVVDQYATRLCFVYSLCMKTVYHTLGKVQKLGSSVDVLVASPAAVDHHRRAVCQRRAQLL